MEPISKTKTTRLKINNTPWDLEIVRSWVTECVKIWDPLQSEACYAQPNEPLTEQCHPLSIHLKTHRFQIQFREQVNLQTSANFMSLYFSFKNVFPTLQVTLNLPIVLVKQPVFS